jgi:hypothetical protein
MAITLNRIVQVNKSVISAGFTPAALIGNFLTENILLPADTNRVLPFANVAAVGAYFGTTSDEYLVAQNYFNSFSNKTQAPQSILFSRYVESPTTAYMFSSTIANPSATVTAIKAVVSPTMTTFIDGVTQTLVLTQSDFASATGLTDIATVIQTALDVQLAGCTCTVIGNNQFTIEAPTSSPATRTIGYCTGNIGELMNLNLDNAPTLSQGTTGGNAAFNMGIILNDNPNWIALSYVTRLTGDTLGAGYPITIDLSAWIASQSANYLGFWWEGGTEPYNTASTTSLSAVLVAAGYGNKAPSGQVTFNTPFQLDYNGIGTDNPITTDEVGSYSAFYAGMGASIDYTAVNGKINFAGKQQLGLAVNVSDTVTYDALLLNGYNVYGSFASRASAYQLTENGSIGGAYLWVDNVYDSVWLADQLQNSVATLLANINRVPYNQTGIALITGVLSNVISTAQKNGVIEKGNTFDPTQVAQVIDIVGTDVTPLLTANGYFVYFPPITAIQRINRLPFVINVLYSNGGAINQVIINQEFVS